MTGPLCTTEGESEKSRCTTARISRRRGPWSDQARALRPARSRGRPRRGPTWHAMHPASNAARETRRNRHDQQLLLRVAYIRLCRPDGMTVRSLSRRCSTVRHMPNDYPQQQTSGTHDGGHGKVLNRHGYAFQHSVVRAAVDAHRAGRSPWRLEVAEFPVSVGTFSTRIDAVLARDYGHRTSMLVVECKRVDPKMGKWCFMRAPDRGRDVDANPVTGERLRFAHDATWPGTRLQRVWGAQTTVSGEVCDLGVELRVEGGDGEGTGSGRKAIDDACHQLCIGMNGLVEYYGRLLAPPQPLAHEVTLIPVLVTNASLCVSDVVISEADLVSGRLSRPEGVLARVPLVYYRYHQEARIIHSWSPTSTLSAERVARPSHATHRYLPEMFALGRALTAQYVRTIAIVSASNLVPFLNEALD